MELENGTKYRSIAPISAGHHQCVLLPRKTIGRIFTVRQFARGGNSNVCAPEEIRNGPGRADFVFFGEGGTAHHKCFLP